MSGGDWVRQAMESAARSFGGDDGVFNAAGFGVEFGKRCGARVVDGRVVAAVLGERDDVERLAGGGHYRIRGRLGTLASRVEWWLRARPWARAVARRLHLAEVDEVLVGAHQAGLIDSWALHELDARLKYEPAKPFHKRAEPGDRS